MYLSPDGRLGFHYSSCKEAGNESYCTYDCVRATARAHRSGEIEESMERGLFTEGWAGCGQAGSRKGRGAPKAGSNGELVPLLGPPGAAGGRGDRNLGTTASRRWAPVVGRGRGWGWTPLALPSSPSHGYSPFGAQSRWRRAESGLRGAERAARLVPFGIHPCPVGEMCPQHRGTRCPTSL